MGYFVYTETINYKKLFKTISRTKIFGELFIELENVYKFTQTY